MSNEEFEKISPPQFDMTVDEIVEIYAESNYLLLSSVMSDVIDQNGIGNIDDIIRNHTGDFFKSCSKEQYYVANQLWRQNESRSEIQTSMIERLPDNLRNELLYSIVDVDYERLLNINQNIIEDEWYDLLSEEEKKNLNIELGIIVQNRDNLIKYVSSVSGVEVSRASPGDRMIWRDMASRMDDAERKDVLKASVEGVLIGVGGGLSAAAGLAWSYISRMF